MRALVLLGLALALLSGLPAKPPAASPSRPQSRPSSPAAPVSETKAAERPRLVLVIVVDQLRFDLLTRFAHLHRAGLRKLLDRGLLFTEARYRHASTETAPGHATILSGHSPRHTGIVANSWYDRLQKKEITSVSDPTATLVDGTDRRRPGASPLQFVGYSLGDALKGASPESRVVGVSFKDRSAILPGGRRADAAYWFDLEHGRFVTSTYYMPRLPAWLEAWNQRRRADAYHGTPWLRLLDEGLYRELAGEDAVSGESDGVHTTFPHALSGRPGEQTFYESLRATPFIDELTLEVALEALQHHELGTDAATDLLSVSFSATDIVGHIYGPDSQEAMDQALRLDVVLGRLLDDVERRVGLSHTLVVLTADHGVAPLAEHAAKRGLQVSRLRPSVFEDPVARALKEAFPGVEGLVPSTDGPAFFLDEDVIEAHGLRRSAVEAAIEKALQATGWVEAVYTTGRLQGDPPPGDEAFPLFRNACFPGRSPDVIGRLRPYVSVTSYPGGTTHGTHHDYDRHVPVLFLGPGIAPGRSPRPCGPEDIAATLARLLGLRYPLQEGTRAFPEVAP